MIPYDVESGKKSSVIRRHRKPERSWKRLRKNQSHDFLIGGNRPRVIGIQHKPLLHVDRNSF